MDPGDWLTRGTIWVSLAAAVAAEALHAFRSGARPAPTARWLNTAGCALLLLHFAAAFHYHHHWSHAAAYADTARQTREWTGWNWGGGLYLNYLFGLSWIAWTLADWFRPGGVTRLPRHWQLLWRGLFLFMLINGAVVFARPGARLPGLLLGLALIASWWKNPAPKVDRTARLPPR